MNPNKAPIDNIETVGPTLESAAPKMVKIRLRQGAEPITGGGGIVPPAGQGVDSSEFELSEPDAKEFLAHHRDRYREVGTESKAAAAPDEVN